MTRSSGVRKGSIAVGILVGGRSERMGGRAKGLLPTPERGEPIVVRLVRVVRVALGHDVDVQLVGRADEYAELGVPILGDAVHDAGPIGGLIALLEHGRAREAEYAIALAGDLPFVSEDLFQKLAEHATEADVVAPQIDGIWQPLFARYACERALGAARERLALGRRSLRGVIEALHAVAMPIATEQAALLRDWDTPQDVQS